MTKHYYTKGLDIPQDADSVRYPIPEGYTAKIENGAFSLVPKESDDEKIRNEILEYFTITRGRDFVANPERQKWISYIEKQKGQKPEWSEEDEAMLDIIIDDIQFVQKAHNHEIDQVYYEREIDWLKSLRPQSHWKPSEEQMKVLDIILTDEAMDDNVHRILVEMKKQLQELT